MTPRYRLALLALAATCLAQQLVARADDRTWPREFGNRAALERYMKQHPPTEAELGAPLFPGAVYDAACSTDYTWERRNWNIVGWCFKVKADAAAMKRFITGEGRPYGPSAILFGDGLLYQTDPKRQAFFESFPDSEPGAAELKVRRHPDMRYDRTCSAERSYDLVLHARTDKWRRAWCFVGDAPLVDLRRFFRFGELSDQRAGALVTMTQVIDQPPRTELEYLIPVQ